MAVTDFIAIDVETANADFASICAIGLAHFRGGQLFQTLKILIDPEDDFDPINIAIHGIRPEDVAGKPTISRALPAIEASLANVVAVHHSPFDKTAFARSATKYGTSALSCVWLDTMRVARRAWPNFAANGGYGLSSLAARLDIDFSHHDPADDARAAGLIMLQAIETTGLGLEDWLQRVELPISGIPSGKHAKDGNPAGALFPNVVVFTGQLEIPRVEAAAAAAKCGCTVADTVSRRTTILVVGDQDLRKTKGQSKSSKHRKVEEMIAQGAPIRIVGESDFMSMIS